MERIIITIRFENQDSEYDLDVSANLTANLLIKQLKKFFINKGNNINKEKKYFIKVKFQSRILNPNETLAEAGVWDGSTMELIES